MTAIEYALNEMGMRFADKILLIGSSAGGVAL